MFSQIPIFQLAESRLAWTGARQKVLAQNIANIDTPHWVSKDVAPFAASLKRAAGSGPALPMMRTDDSHLAPSGGGESSARVNRGERAPDGNSVSLEDQLTRIAETDSAHELTSDIYRKYLGMFRTVIGH